MKRLSLLTFALLLVACRGKIAGTVPLAGDGDAEANIQTTGGKLTLWADTDGKWEGSENTKIDIRYDIEILQQGKSLARLTCQTSDANTSVCGTHTNIMGQHDADCELKLRCDVPAIPAGETVFRVKGTTGTNVKMIRKMSLNVRSGS